MGDGKVRRVVKGFDNEGRSTIVSDGASPAIKSIPGRPDYYSTNVWRTGAAPVDITEPDLIERMWAYPRRQTAPFCGLSIFFRTERSGRTRTLACSLIRKNLRRCGYVAWQ